MPLFHAPSTFEFPGVFLSEFDGWDSTDVAVSLAAWNAAVAATPRFGNLWLPEAADIHVGSTFLVDKEMSLLGAGAERPTRFITDAALGLNPALHILPGAGTHHVRLMDFSVDCTATPAALGIVAENFDNLDGVRVMTRGGLGWLLYDMAICSFERCDAYNPRVDGWTVDGTVHGTKSVGMWWDRCLVYWTSSQVPPILAGGAGWHLLDGRDMHWIASYALRAPGITSIVPWGYNIDVDAGGFGGFFFSAGSESDGIEDGTAAASITCAAMRLHNAHKVQVDSMWLSAAPSGENAHPAVLIDAGDEIRFGADTRFSGNPAIAIRNAPDAVSVEGSIAATCTTAIFDIDNASPPTNLAYDLDTSKTTAPLTVAAQAAAFKASLRPRARNRSASAASLINGGQTVREPWNRLGWSPATLAAFGTGVMAVVRIPLYAGDLITGITFNAAGALSWGTNNDGHIWAALYDPTLTLMAQSADQTGVAVAWAANANKDFTLTAQQYVPSDGLYAVGLMIAVGTGGAPAMPTMRGISYPTVNIAGGAANGLPAGMVPICGTNGAALVGVAPAGPIVVTSGSAAMYCAAH